MPAELALLAWSCLLVFAHLALQAAAVQLEHGPVYAGGPRDEERPVTARWARRAERALRNLMETFPVFAAAVLAVVLAGRTGELTLLGAQLYLWGRIAYLPLYVFGVPYLRSLAWAVAFAGIVMNVWPLIAG